MGPPPLGSGYGLIGYNHDYTETHAYACDAENVGFLIGNRGSTIYIIKHDSDAFVEIQEPDPFNGRHKPWFLIRGYSHQCQAAIRIMNELLGKVIKRDSV